MSELDALQAEVGGWGTRTFPNSTVESIHKHFREEVGELSESVDGDRGWGSVAEEAADCVLLLLHLAHRLNFSLDDAIRHKFAKCQRRKWDSGAGRGYSRHVEGDPTADAERAGEEVGA